MKIIRINLSEEQKTELRQIQKNQGDLRSERALAVIHCSEGMKATEIARLLKRRINTICDWLNAFVADGIAGLSRKYSSGRPSRQKSDLLNRLEAYLSSTPRDFGWGEDVWSVKVICAQFKKDTGKDISPHTVRRTLSTAGYSYKKPKKTTPLNAPTKDEKIERVQKIIQEISELAKTGEVEVMFLDESHFSTDPYNVKGWIKKGQPFFPADSQEIRKLHNIWGIRTKTRCFLLEEFE